MSEIKKAIVNVSTSAYTNGRLRLEDSLKGRFDGEAMLWSDEKQVGSPSHTENPYAFKIYAIEEALKMGYNNILWLDASVYAVKDTQPVFDLMRRNGVFMEAAGHFVGTWSNDYALAYFGISREEANTIPMFSAGFIGFDFTKSVAVEFFNRWKRSMLAGCFEGSWTDHRHDMTCGSIIAHQMNLTHTYNGAGDLFAYIGGGYSAPKESAIFYLESGI